MNGRVALITGGASGIGRAVAEAMSRRGAKVVLADRQLERAKSVATDIGKNARAVELDVRDADAFDQVAKDVNAELGRIDYLFNNAGIAVGGEMADYDKASWDDVIAVNLNGVAYGINAVYPIMRKQGSGHIINTASMAGLMPTAGVGSYTATKHAVVGISKALRIEAARYGVRVSALCPGAIRTPILTGGEFGRTVGRQLKKEDQMKVWETMRPMDVNDFARELLIEVGKNKPYIILPRWWKAVWLLERAAPSLSLKIWAIFHERTVKMFDELGVDADASDQPKPGSERVMA